jgi:hypothetical protein
MECQDLSSHGQTNPQEWKKIDDFFKGQILTMD